jgi:hypothetical protein
LSAPFIIWREAPLVEINNSEELEAWLQKQPREVSVAFAARAALRVLPLLQEDGRIGLPQESFWQFSVQRPSLGPQ